MQICQTVQCLLNTRTSIQVIPEIRYYENEKQHNVDAQWLYHHPMSVSWQFWPVDPEQMNSVGPSWKTILFVMGQSLKHFKQKDKGWIHKQKYLNSLRTEDTSKSVDSPMIILLFVISCQISTSYHPDSAPQYKSKLKQNAKGGQKMFLSAQIDGNWLCTKSEYTQILLCVPNDMLYPSYLFEGNCSWFICGGMLTAI